MFSRCQWAKVIFLAFDKYARISRFDSVERCWYTMSRVQRRELGIAKGLHGNK